MISTPFHAYHLAMKLNMLQDEDALLPVFAEGNISVYPYQIAAALFAMRNPYQKGVILCDEAGMGKSIETMLILSQCWYEGKTKIIIAIPNPDLLVQWKEMIDDNGVKNVECKVENVEIKDENNSTLYILNSTLGTKEKI